MTIRVLLQSRASVATPSAQHSGIIMVDKWKPYAILKLVMCYLVGGMLYEYTGY
ncbi:hypothetical protein MELA_01684 [Candidatus Methylomirabilis lanthanidiphila]|uniref:Uncharacterized protein n=1 Tax=Candidatus Methylomirabilis lanthanidiphila TaxID=2211376 RepID=A0A564ZIX9_9BACT|nr:hypothetical protein MELA_01684 [Candidatus Methylomirabilis lanthanidiphila]